MPRPVGLRPVPTHKGILDRSQTPNRKELLLPCALSHLHLMFKSALTPPLKWAGGKRWLVPQIHTLWKQSGSTRLVEPFAGGLAITLGIAPQRAFLNDINPHLINFYQQIQQGLNMRAVLLGGLEERIISNWAAEASNSLRASELRALAKAQDTEEEQGIRVAFASERATFAKLQKEHKAGTLENERGFYYAARAEFNRLYASDAHLSPEGATLFYYLNRTGFNGLCRFSMSRRDELTGKTLRGHFNVPYGRYNLISYRYDFEDYHQLLRDWCFSCGDFAELSLRAGDFLYIDPPYDTPFTSYSEGGFSWKDQVRLMEWLDGFKGPIVLSNQATERVIKLYMTHGYGIHLENAKRSISSKGSTRGPVKEVVALRGIGAPPDILSEHIWNPSQGLP